MCHLSLPINNLYVKILDNKLSDTTLCQFQEVVGSIIVLKTTLSATSLQQLLDIPRPIYVAGILHRFHFVIDTEDDDENDVNRYVRHPSFRNFITDPKRCTDLRFLINLSERHTYLAYKCFDWMHNSMANWSFDDTVIPSPLRYAICHVMDHLYHVESDSKASFLNLLRKLIEEKLTQWLQALFKAGRHRDAIPSVKRAFAWVVSILTSLL